MSNRTRYRVRVVNKAGLESSECPTDDRHRAEEYARTAVEDGCATATVVLTNGGHQVSWWDATELRLWDGRTP